MEEKETTRFCIYCGAPIADGDMFCMNCGEKVEPQEATPGPVSKPLPEKPVCKSCGAELGMDDAFCMQCGAKVVIKHEPAIEPSMPVQSEIEPTTKQSKKRMGIILGAVAAVVLIAAGALLFTQFGGDKASSNDTNAANDAGLTDTTISNATPDTVLEATIDTNTDVSLPDSSDGTGDNGDTVISYEDLYVGAWAAEGTIVGDEANGWQALYLESAGTDSLTFSLEKVQSAPSNRTASTYPITVILEKGTATFPVSDSWGNSGSGKITVIDGCIHVVVEITSAAPNSMWDISMDADFSPQEASQTASTPTSQANTGSENKSSEQGSNEPTTQPVSTGLGTSEQAIIQEFVYQSTRNGASFSVENPSFILSDDGDGGNLQFDFGEETASFGYLFDRSYGEISIGDVSNSSKLTELANAAFLIISDSDDSTSFKGLPSQVWNSEPAEHYTRHDEAAAAQYGDFYSQTVTDIYTGTYTADGYECTFYLVHCYHAMQSGRMDDTYSGNIKFYKSEG